MFNENSEAFISNFQLRSGVSGASGPDTPDTPDICVMTAMYVLDQMPFFWVVWTAVWKIFVPDLPAHSPAIHSQYIELTQFTH